MWKERRVVRQQDIVFQLADIENDKGAETLPHGSTNRLDQRCGLLNGGSDEIGGMGSGDIARGEIFRAAGQMQTEERQWPVDMQPAVLSEITADRLARRQAGHDIIHQIGKGGRCAASGGNAHRRDLRHSSRTG
ncbi:hypothetical protein D3C80_793170 [compost metagenome]